MEAEHFLKAELEFFLFRRVLPDLLYRRYEFLQSDRSFAQDLDLAARAIHQRGGDSAGCFAAIHDERNASAELSEDFLGGGWTG